jgi:hypothetical protein
MNRIMSLKQTTHGVGKLLLKAIKTEKTTDHNKDPTNTKTLAKA